MIGKVRIYLWFSLTLMCACAVMLGKALIQTIKNEWLLIQSPEIAMPVWPGYTAEDVQHAAVSNGHFANISHLLVLLGALVVAIVSANLIRKAIIGKLISHQSARQNKIIIWILCVLLPLKIISDSYQRLVETYMEITRTGGIVFHNPDFVQVDWGVFLVIPLALALSCLLHEAIKMQGDLDGTV
jgi:hypothetical protein